MSLPQYPEYRNSGIEWLAMIPAHWSIGRLKFLGRITSSGIDKHSHKDESKIRFLGTDSVYSRNELDNSLVLPTCTASKNEIKRLSLSLGDIIVTKDSVVPTRIADAAIVVEPLDNVVCGYHLILFRAEKKVAYPKFLFYQLASRQVNEHFLSIARGTTIIGISSDLVGDTYLCCPPVNEQAVIAAFLDCETTRIDALIEEQKHLIKLLQEKRQAVISHAVTKGLDPDVPMKDSGVEWLGDVPAHWEIRKASYIGRLFGSENVPEDMVSEEGDLPYLKVGSLSTDSLEVDRWDWHIEQSVAGQYRACEHYVVFPKRGAAIFLNKVNVVSCQALIDPNLMGWEIEGVQSTWYFAYALKLRKLDELADISTVPQINNKHIGPEKFPVPPADEQEMIADYLNKRSSEIAQLMSTARTGVRLLQERRSALISAAVTGKIDLRHWQASAEAEAESHAMAAEPKAAYESKSS